MKYYYCILNKNGQTIGFDKTIGFHPTEVIDKIIFRETVEYAIETVEWMIKCNIKGGPFTITKVHVTIHAEPEEWRQK